MSEAPRLSNEGLVRPHLLLYYRIAAILMVAIVLLQALLAGQYFGKGDKDYLDMHEMVANLVFLVALALGGLAISLGVPAAWKVRFLALHALLVVLVIAQIGLGYSGEDSGEAAAWHFPNGVLIFGLSVFILSLLPYLRRANGAS